MKGGFYLTKTNLKQPIISVIYAIDGTYRMNSCLLSLDNCDKNKPCPLHKIANPMRSKLINSLKEKTFEDLSLEIQSGETFLPL